MGLLRDLKHIKIREEIRNNFISYLRENDAIRTLISSDGKTQIDLEKALEVGLKRYNHWFVEKMRKEFEEV